MGIQNPNSATVIVDENGSTVVNADTLNFTGAGVTVTASGATADIAVSGGGGGGGINTGTTFPVSPAVDDLFFRTTDNLLYFWNGTDWLTVTEYYTPFTTVNSLVGSVDHFAAMPMGGAYSLVVTSIQMSDYTSAPGVTAQAQFGWIDNANIMHNIGTLFDNSGGVDWNVFRSVVNLGIDKTYCFAFRVIYTENNSGAAWICAGFNYRLIGA